MCVSAVASRIHTPSRHLFSHINPRTLALTLTLTPTPYTTGHPDGARVRKTSGVLPPRTHDRRRHCTRRMCTGVGVSGGVRGNVRLIVGVQGGVRIRVRGNVSDIARPMACLPPRTLLTNPSVRPPNPVWFISTYFFSSLVLSFESI